MAATRPSPRSPGLSLWCISERLWQSHVQVGLHHAVQSVPMDIVLETHRHAQVHIFLEWTHRLREVRMHTGALMLRVNINALDVEHQHQGMVMLLLINIPC